ncbi:MAG: urate hydroxylase PuuD [Alphaproteobacteria bacterium GM202ARS2]|nr:urate hydroxylase PuuD [Alphaproteobacteria bacterium GM202ARS2]
MAQVIQFFSSLRNTLIVGVILLLMLHMVQAPAMDIDYFRFLFRWLHVVSGVMWIGLLWYFNFVQIPNMARIPDAQKPAITGVIAPQALFWFRWAAASTVLTGLIVAMLNGYLIDTLTLEMDDDFVIDKYIALGIGMWLGIIMFLNVWLVIWPNQKRALGIVKVGDKEKKASAATAMLFSRINTALSIPMLYAMVAAQNLG